MKVKFKIYETPQPEDAQREHLSHARVQSVGTVHLYEMCEELRDLGVNSAQIKAVLDASGKFLFKWLQLGYHVEFEEIGTFSLSLRSKPFMDESGKKTMRVEADGVNFRCNKRLKEKVREIELYKVKPDKNIMPGEITRKKRLLAYLEKKAFINIAKYAELNNCSRYISQRDLLAFVEEKWISVSGKGAHKVYILAE
ncbi:putative histone-like DNA-binding protein [Parabacteroides sp. PM5-20]|uniref:HU family DNA-binding protein n=1 Tax=Parabacteroides sp. PM5-20 TaxID=2940527 RepID=UPI0024746D4F|nr:DNA-binding protein [Parabacteroides sp. PM5-20]MDH6533532.1 putative histone-like DNA-binding protein [Parabacteroides sp. PM5-20]